MFPGRLSRSRIPPLRPLRPPSVLPHSAPNLRLFSKNTQLLLVAQRASRPQLPYLAQPTFKQQPQLVLNGPSHQLARLLSTENKRYVGQQLYLAIKWTAVAWTFAALCFVAWLGVQIELHERKNPTPEEWRFKTKWMLRSARVQLEATDRVGAVDWARVGAMLSTCLERLEDLELDGEGLLEREEGGTLIPAVGKAGYDISSKSWPWRSGYFEVIMGCATAAEHLDGRVLDTTRGIVFPADNMIGPSNPDPRPVPAYSMSAPLEENCTNAFAPPETFYMRVLTGQGFTTRQKLDAVMGYANWLEYKGLHDSAEEMYRWGIDIAKGGMEVDGGLVLNDKTAVLNPERTRAVTPNLLRATTTLAIHQARTGNVSGALPILLSVLRARRNAPELPHTAEILIPTQDRPRTDLDQAANIFRQVFRAPKYPPPPPSGDKPQARSSEKPTCEESELMLYIGEILFATSEDAAEGVRWTRQAVMIAEANLQQNATDAQGSASGDVDTADAACEERRKCKDCLRAGVNNWEVMLQRLVDQKDLAAEREGGQNAGSWERRGWFGKDENVKGKTLNKASAELLEAEIKQVERLKARVVREGINEEMARVKGAQSATLWIG